MSRYSRRTISLNDRNGLDEETFRAIKPAVLTRDQHTCQGCGIELLPFEDSPSGGLDVHHKNKRPNDNNEDNLISLCRLCHGIFHIGFFAREWQKGMLLIHCPECAQRDLNLLSWTMAIAFRKMHTSSNKSIAYSFHRLLRTLKRRTQIDDSYFDNKEDTDRLNTLISQKPNIAFFGTLLGILRSRNPTAYADRARWLGGLRVFYDPTADKVFEDRRGHDLAAHLAETQAWQKGSGWAETWLSISNQCANEML